VRAKLNHIEFLGPSSKVVQSVTIAHAKSLVFVRRPLMFANFAFYYCKNSCFPCFIALGATEGPSQCRLAFDALSLSVLPSLETAVCIADTTRLDPDKTARKRKEHRSPEIIRSQQSQGRKCSTEVTGRVSSNRLGMGMTRASQVHIQGAQAIIGIVIFKRHCLSMLQSKQYMLVRCSTIHP